ncbi:uncharacterized protein BKCO1_15000125 [Diplodia corticola]|uniref:Uncharacterized protein n=1 Tax=Diplodia corticola TaxID=236234 RepID=A0A1J9S824_9PEZI|nr:uncharacterized protein BKCO1_15000125 [Diplodia corticola]OJD35733.1 hypothetical protein BKCO1_15000125 [Diplodia corticola]
MAPSCNAALCRREDTDDGGENAARLRTIGFASYVIAFLVAAAVITYIIAYIQPPQTWKWYCRLHGRRPVEPPCSSPPPPSPTNGPTNGTLVADVGEDDGLSGRRAGRAGEGRGWVRGAVARLLMRRQQQEQQEQQEQEQQQQPGNEPRNGSIPGNHIRCTEVYVVRYEPALELQHSTSKPATATATATNDAWPLENNRYNTVEALDSKAEPKVYGAGKLPWGSR